MACKLGVRFYVFYIVADSIGDGCKACFEHVARFYLILQLVCIWSQHGQMQRDSHCSMHPCEADTQRGQPKVVKKPLIGSRCTIAAHIHQLQQELELASA